MSPTLRRYRSCKNFSFLFRHTDCITSDTCEPFLMCSPNSYPVLFRLAEKELQRKSLEDSLNAERSSGASRETNMQV